MKHQKERIAAKQPYVSIDAVADFRELTDVKIAAGTTGLFMVGGGVPKNFAQDTVVCAEILGVEADMHKYAVQITVADVRDGACSSSTLKEAASWGKVDTTYEQMVFAEATTVVPLIGSDAYHRGAWKNREKRRWQKLFACLFPRGVEAAPQSRITSTPRNRGNGGVDVSEGLRAQGLVETAARIRLAKKAEAVLTPSMKPRIPPGARRKPRWRWARRESNSLPVNAMLLIARRLRAQLSFKRAACNETAASQRHPTAA